MLSIYFHRAKLKAEDFQDSPLENILDQLLICSNFIICSQLYLLALDYYYAKRAHCTLSSRRRKFSPSKKSVILKTPDFFGLHRAFVFVKKTGDKEEYPHSYFVIEKFWAWGWWNMADTAAPSAFFLPFHNYSNIAY